MTSITLKEARQLATHVDGHHKEVIDAFLNRLEKWESVFGHLGEPDEVGNRWHALSDRLEETEKERDALRAAIEAIENSRNEEKSTACKLDNDLSDEALWAGIAAGMITPAHIARPTVAEQERIEKERDALRARISEMEQDAAHQKALAESALRVAEGWERKCGELRAENAGLVDDMNLLRDNNASLRARIEEMEKREPIRLVTAVAYRWRYRGAVVWQYGELTEETVRVAKDHNHEVQSLYLATGAKGEEK